MLLRVIYISRDFIIIFTILIAPLLMESVYDVFYRAVSTLDCVACWKEQNDV
jgi:hypothetical protein